MFSVGCFRADECIFSGYVCDGEVDCSNAADEPPLATCENHEQEFTKVTITVMNCDDQRCPGDLRAAGCQGGGVLDQQEPPGLPLPLRQRQGLHVPRRQPLPGPEG